MALSLLARLSRAVVAAVLPARGGLQVRPKRPGAHDCRVWVWLVLAGLAGLAPIRASADDVLLDYVRAPDPAYGYQPVEVVQRPGCAIHVLKMVSQRWRSHAEVNRVLWRHWLAVVVPDGVRSDVAMLIVEGGINSRFRPGVHNPVVAAAEYIAKSTHTAVIALGQVPNEPLSFRDGAGSLMEDELVAKTWAKAMSTGDYTWPAYVPMVKSTVRAMDTVQDYMQKVIAHPVGRFVLVGFSKRGAAAWLTAAVDARVMALGSGVFDVLDIVDQIERHYEAYGSYASELHAYLDFGVLRRLRSPEGAALLRVIDPYFYLDRVTQPKFLINATGDPFFLPDAARQYTAQLRGETLLRYVPNADHSLRNRKTSVRDIVDGLVVWYESLITGAGRPQIEWTVADGRLRVTSRPAPQAARLWRADNPRARDFRKQTIGESWQSEPLTPDADGTIEAPLVAPARGWRADFIELHYPGANRLTQIYTTPVVVLPDTLPFTLSDPVGHPRNEVDWAGLLPRMVRGDLSAGVNAWELSGAFPLPLFDAHVPDLAAAAAVMAEPDGAATQARQACLAVRLNIAHDDLGWYSRMEGRRYLWQVFADADAAYRHGEPERARDLCQDINRTRRTPG